MEKSPYCKLRELRLRSLLMEAHDVCRDLIRSHPEPAFYDDLRKDLDHGIYTLQRSIPDPEESRFGLHLIRLEVVHNSDTGFPWEPGTYSSVSDLAALESTGHCSIKISLWDHTPITPDVALSATEDHGSEPDFLQLPE